MPLLAATLALITPAFSSVDAVIVIVYLLGSVALGLLANRVVSGIGGYLVAGRTLGTALAIATMTGSELGLITVMYQAQKGFTGGFAALHIGVIAGLVTLVVGLTGFIVAPLREAGVMTIPEYYERRFGRRTRILGGVLLALGGILNMGLFLRVGSQFVVGVTGLDPHGATLPLIMLGLLTLVLIYTVLGGMVSVVLTDYVQFVILSIGLVLVTILAARHFGQAQLVDVVASLLAGRKPATPAHSTCIECKIAGNVCVMVAHGTPCLGPVTHAGCGALCPSYDRGCYGCYGPKETPNAPSLSSRLAELGMDAGAITRVYSTFNSNAEAFRQESERHGAQNDQD